jgi:hypothetical protein
MLCLILRFRKDLYEICIIDEFKKSQIYNLMHIRKRNLNRAFQILKGDKISFIFNGLSLFIFSKFDAFQDSRSLSASGGLPHLPASGIFELRQMPSRIADYSGTASSPAEVGFR